MLRVGLIGLGTIGHQVADGILAGRAGEVELCAILVRRPRVAPPSEAFVLTDFDALLTFRPDVVVEAASADALTSYAEPLLRAGTSLIISSASALVDASLRSRLATACRESGARVYVPAGALGGLDALAAAAVAGLDVASLRVIEPGGSGRRHVFRGSALDAAMAFPGRLNIAATAALATGVDVSVVLEESAAEGRTIELSARGPFGELFTRLRPEVRTEELSHIVALSLLATLRRLEQPFWFG